MHWHGGNHGYYKVKDIGAGSFGKCILVKTKDDKHFVMKTVDTSRMSGKERKQAQNEVKVLSGLKHPYIISYRESFMENFQLCIVMDYAEGGDLFKIVDRTRRKCQQIGEPKILRWMTQSFLAIKYLHDKHVLHRDLKSQNIFLSGSGRIKLGDFGISKVLEGTECFAKTSIGTPYYLAPEICSQRPYSWAADIWALGCILFEMSMLRVPFDAQNFKQLCDRITRTAAPKISSNFSPELRELCADMLQREARKRPTASDILQRPIIQGEIRKMLEEEKQKKASDVSKVAAEVDPHAAPAPAQENAPPPNLAPNLQGSPRKAAPAPRNPGTPRSARDAPRVRESPRGRQPSPAPVAKVAPGRPPSAAQRHGHAGHAPPHYQQYSPRIRAPAIGRH